MKRVALALLGGFIIPFVYTVIAATLSVYVTNSTIDQFLMYPVRWPILIFFRLGFMPFENETAILIYMIVCDVGLYSILSYFLLGRFFKPKKRVLSLPPEPPEENQYPVRWPILIFFRLGFMPFENETAILIYMKKI